MIQMALSAGLILMMVSGVFAEPYVFSRDPFAPVSSDVLSSMDSMYEAPKDERVTISLRGIIWDQEDPLAVLRVQRLKRIVGIGDDVSGYMVDDISQTEIVLKADDKTFILGLGKELRQ